MTQQITINLATASAVELIQWLAEKPCAECNGRRQLPAQAYVGGATGKVDCRACLDANSEPTGLAFEWASAPCICGGDTCLCHACAITNAVEGGSDAHRADACRCRGSGRVPKALGLAELHIVLRNLGQGVRIEYRLLATGRIDCLVSDTLHADYIATGIGDTDTEAALRAVEKAATP